MKLLKVIALSFSFLCMSAQAQNISIATGGTGGVYYPMGGGLASVLSSKVPGMSATAEVTGGSVDNLNLIGSGKPYVGFSMADAAKDAQTGEGKFSGKKVDLKTLVVLYPNLMHVVTVDSTGIKTMKDLKGKRVSTGAPGSATEVMAFRLLEAAGLDKDKDVKRERLSVAESVNAVKDRKIDAFFWVGGLPTAAVTDLANTPGTKIVMVDTNAEVGAMNKKYGNLYFDALIPKATYSGMAKDNKVALQNQLRNRLSDSFIAGLQKLFVEHYVEVPQSKVNVVEALAKNVKSLKTKLKDAEAKAVKLHEESREAVQRERLALKKEHKARLIAEAASAVTAADRGAFVERANTVKFAGTKEFKKDLIALREQYFGAKTSVDERPSNEPVAAPLFETKQPSVSSVDAYTKIADRLTGRS